MTNAKETKRRDILPRTALRSEWLFYQILRVHKLPVVEVQIPLRVCVPQHPLMRK